MLNGRFKGEISTTDTLIIGDKGVMNGDVRAGQVLISGEVVGNVVGGAAATAGAIATAPFRAFDNSYNYYGYGYGGRDWKTYAAHNKLACTPGTTFKGPDGQQHLCQ